MNQKKIPEAIKEIQIAYFSPCGGTKAICRQLGNILSELFHKPATILDLTPPKNRNEEHPISIAPHTLMIIGMPTYAGKLPNKLLPHLKFETSDSYAIPLVTFGGRSFDNSLAELSEILLRSGFSLPAAGAIQMPHVFSEQIGNPHARTLAVASVSEFAAKLNVLLVAEISADASDMPGAEIPALTLEQIPGRFDAPYYTPLGEDHLPAKFLKAKPQTDLSLCDHCHICVKKCPMGSISIEDDSSVPGICIKCMACVKSCPQQAKYFDDPALLSHIRMLENHVPSSNEAYQTEWFMPSNSSSV